MVWTQLERAKGYGYIERNHPERCAFFVANWDDEGRRARGMADD